MQIFAGYGDIAPPPISILRKEGGENEFGLEYCPSGVVCPLK